MYFGGGVWQWAAVFAQKEKKTFTSGCGVSSPGLRGLHGRAVPSPLRSLRWIRLVFCRSGRLFFLALTLLLMKYLVPL